MNINLHANAATTPKQRALIQRSTAPVSALAKELGVHENTIRKWRKRTDTTDRSSQRHNLGASTTPTEEELIVALRQDVRLSLDDLVEVVNRCVNPNLKRSSVRRCLVRKGAMKLPSQQSDSAPSHKKFEEASCGFIHIDLKHLPRLEGKRSYVFAAIDRATRFVFIEIITDRSAATITACLEHFLEVFPYPVHTILTDNGSEFTDRFGAARQYPKGRKPTGKHLFDRVCRANNIEHRLTKPYHPQTNGMVERFNRRIAEALRNHPAASTNGGKNKFLNHEARDAFLHNFVDNYNRTRLRCLGYTAPLTKLHNLTEDNTGAGRIVSAEP